MEIRNVQLSLEKAKEWYNKGGELKEVALQAYKEDELNPPTYEQVLNTLFTDTQIAVVAKFPYSSPKCNEVGKAADILCPSIEAVKKVKAFSKLLNTAIALNQGWIPDYTDTNDKFYFVQRRDCGKVSLDIRGIQSYNYGMPCFKDYKTAEKARRILGEETILNAISQIAVL